MDLSFQVQEDGVKTIGLFFAMDLDLQEDLKRIQTLKVGLLIFLRLIGRGAHASVLTGIHKDSYIGWHLTGNQMVNRPGI